MMFTPAEQTELTNARMVLKGSNKSLVLNKQTSSSKNNNSANTSNLSSEGDKKRGFFG